jgi:hydroxyacid-oxoacid transhydrogenase
MPDQDSVGQEYAFEMAASGIRFGFGATREVGADLADLGLRRALVFTDATLRSMEPVVTVLESLEKNGISFTVYDRVRVEPSDESILEAVRFAAGHNLRCDCRCGRRVDDRHGESS